MEIDKDNIRYCATCYFLDVGQGTSQVVSLGQQQAVVIDTGKSCRQGIKSPVLILLNELQIDHIKALILSHNDNDHTGELANIIYTYRNKIEKVFLLKDRLSLQNDVYKMIMAAVKDGYLHRDCVYSLVADDLNRNLFNTEQLNITVLYPDVLANLGNEKNNTCAIIALTIGTQKIIFSGDAPVEAWEFVAANNGKQSVQVLTVPHHGGSFVNQNEDECWQWFFENVKTQYAIVSAGTGYGHPKEKVIRTFVQNDSEILCTQSTHECCGGNKTCCGTIIVDVGNEQINVRDIDKLKKKREQFQQRLCLKAV